VQCAGQPVLPVSLKDEMGADTVKVYCPKCSQVYHPPPPRSRTGNAAGVDGAAFGTTFPHLFLMTFSNLVPDPLPSDVAYVPRVFGFRVHKSARLRFNNPPAIEAANNNSINANANDEKKAPEEEQDSINKSVPALETNIDKGDAAAAAAAEAAPPLNAVNAAGAAADQNNRSSSLLGKRANESISVAEPVLNAAVAAAKNNGPANGPTFLIDNPGKRRRRTNNSNNGT